MAEANVSSWQKIETSHGCLPRHNSQNLRSHGWRVSKSIAAASPPPVNKRCSDASPHKPRQKYTQSTACNMPPCLMQLKQPKAVTRFAPSQQKPRHSKTWKRAISGWLTLAESKLQLKCQRSQHSWARSRSRYTLGASKRWIFLNMEKIARAKWFEKPQSKTTARVDKHMSGWSAILKSLTNSNPLSSSSSSSSVLSHIVFGSAFRTDIDSCGKIAANWAWDRICACFHLWTLRLLFLLFLFLLKSHDTSHHTGQLGLVAR